MLNTQSLKYLFIFILFNSLLFCSDKSNALYLIEEKTNYRRDFEFFGKNKSMYIHSENNEIMLSANLKFRADLGRLKESKILLCDKDKNALLGVPFLYMRSQDIELLNSNRNKFNRVRYTFDYSNQKTIDFNKRYQISRKWIKGASWFLYVNKYEDSEPINPTDTTNCK
jgi:hypothetical protein